VSERAGEWHEAIERARERREASERAGERHEASERAGNANSGRNRRNPRSLIPEITKTVSAKKKKRPKQSVCFNKPHLAVQQEKRDERVL